MRNIVKSFHVGEANELEIIHNLDLKINEGEFVAIVGQSGSGKSTLMNMIGALDRPTKGTYMLDGLDVGTLSNNELSDIRNKKIGFVFQTFNLIPRSNAFRNVELPMLYSGADTTKRKDRVEELLGMFGMGERMFHLPTELSGGEKQRVAIARAMANNPPIILADEPTGALDSKTGRAVMDIFHDLHKKEKKTIVFVTHNYELAKETQRIITIADGNIITDEMTRG